MLAVLAQPPVRPPSDLRRGSTQLSGLEPSEAQSPVSSLSLCVGPGRKEPAACSGWWAGDCGAGAGCRCLSEGPACGSGRCAVLVAAHTALSSPSSSALLCPAGSDNAPARGREVFCFCHCHCLCPRVLPLTCLRFSMLGKEKKQKHFLLSALQSPCQAWEFSWGSVGVAPVPLGGGPQWACLGAGWSV